MYTPTAVRALLDKIVYDMRYTPDVADRSLLGLWLHEIDATARLGQSGQSEQPSQTALNPEYAPHPMPMATPTPEPDADPPYALPDGLSPPRRRCHICDAQLTNRIAYGECPDAPNPYKWHEFYPEAYDFTYAASRLPSTPSAPLRPPIVPARLDPTGTAEGKTIIVSGVANSSRIDDGCTHYAGLPIAHVDTETGKRTPLAPDRDTPRRP